MLQMTETIATEILAAMTATGGPFDPADVWLGLFTAIVDHGKDTLIGDLTQATGAVATRVAQTPWGAPYRLTDGRVARDNVLSTFSPASAAEAQVVIGYFLADDAAAGTLLAWDLFPEPVPLVDALSQVSVLLRLTVDRAGRWSESAIIDG
jgi:uncharacterized protein YwbE